MLSEHSNTQRVKESSLPLIHTVFQVSGRTWKLYTASSASMKPRVLTSSWEQKMQQKAEEKAHKEYKAMKKEAQGLKKQVTSK